MIRQKRNLWFVEERENKDIKVSQLVNLQYESAKDKEYVSACVMYIQSLILSSR